MNIYSIYAEAKIKYGTFNEEKFLFYLREAQKGSSKYREISILYSLGLLISIANSFKSRLEKEELASIGLPGLIKAIDFYSFDKKYAFSTYATKLIRNEIFEYLRKDGKHNKVVSLDEYISKKDESPFSLFEYIEDPTLNIEEDIFVQEELSILESLVERLPQYNREVLFLSFGLNGNKRHTLEEIATHYGIKKQAVSNMRIRTLKMLKNEIKIMYIENSLLKSLDILSLEEKQIMELYLGLNGKDPHTIIAISKMLGYDEKILSKKIKEILLVLEEYLSAENYNEIIEIKNVRNARIKH